MTSAAGAAEPWLAELSLEQCLEHLREGSVGRLAVVIDEHPLVVPVNYRLVETVGLRWIAIRTKPGSLTGSAPSRPITSCYDRARSCSTR